MISFIKSAFSFLLVVGIIYGGYLFMVTFSDEINSGTDILKETISENSDPETLHENLGNLINSSMKNASAEAGEKARELLEEDFTIIDKKQSFGKIYYHESEKRKGTSEFLKHRTSPLYFFSLKGITSESELTVKVVKSDYNNYRKGNSLKYENVKMFEVIELVYEEKPPEGYFLAK